MIPANMRTEELLEQSQKLTQELQSQSRGAAAAAGRAQEVELGARGAGEVARQSRSCCSDQQEELQQVNEELEEKASLLAEQNKKVEQKNREVEAARLALEEKAEQLALSSKYKCEFLANMSTSCARRSTRCSSSRRLLADNKDGNLTPKQVEFAQTILLVGHGPAQPDQRRARPVEGRGRQDGGRRRPTCRIDGDARASSSARFRPVAEQKGLELHGRDRSPDVPAPIFTDGQRLQQVLKNLLSNAFKFTEQGGVTLTDPQGRDGPAVRQPRRSTSARDGDRVRGDATPASASRRTSSSSSSRRSSRPTARRAASSAARASASRSAARSRGCSAARSASRARRARAAPSRSSCRRATWSRSRRDDERVARPRAPTRSAPERGSRARGTPRPTPTATSAAASGSCRRPTRRRRRRVRGLTSDDDGARRPTRCGRESLPRPEGFDDDRDAIEPGDRVVLIIENDANFAKILLDMAREKGFKGLVALDGEHGLRAGARSIEPDAITLDIDMPGMDGWEVLDRLKHHPDTRHIPVHIITGIERAAAGAQGGRARVPREAGEQGGARRRVRADRDASSTTRVKRLLVVEDDEAQRERDRGADRARGRGDHRGRHRPRRRSSELGAARTSTAWCSTSACAT